MSDESRVRWAWIVTTLAIAIGVVIFGYVIAARHDRAVTEREHNLQRARLGAAAALEQQKFLSGLVREYLFLDQGAWERRDQVAEFIALGAREKTIKDWATEQRKRLAPALERLEETRRQQWLASMKQQGLDHADTVKDGAEPEDSPAWKKYNGVRNNLRLKLGTLCCKITTGKILFTRANSVDGCRKHAHRLCEHLARAAEKKQKCLYVVAKDCASGEILGGGDVTAGEDKPASEKKDADGEGEE